MNHAHRLVCSSLFALIALASTSSFAATRCDSPSGFVDREACAAAAQGPDALRRFIARTSGMWNLWYFDYATEDLRAVVIPVPAPAESRQVAGAEPTR